MYRGSLVLAGLWALGLSSPIHHLRRGADIYEQYDFVIAGGETVVLVSELTHELTLFKGGTAGMVLANRLTEVAEFRVLVIEAGPEPTVVINYESPGGNQFLGGTAIDVSDPRTRTLNEIAAHRLRASTTYEA